MPNIKSAIKRVQLTERNRQRNLAYKSSVRKSIKQFFSLADSLEKQQASVDDVQGAVNKAFSCIDKAVKKGVIHQNTGARRKARLSRRLKIVTQDARPAESAS